MSTAKEKFIEICKSLSPQQQKIFAKILRLEKEYLHHSNPTHLTKEIENIIREEIK